MSNEIYHHGILGMKWGIRRFQNDDGSLTSAGKKRYGLFGSGDQHPSQGISKKEVKKLVEDYNKVNGTRFKYGKDTVVKKGQYTYDYKGRRLKTGQEVSSSNKWVDKLNRVNPKKEKSIDELQEELTRKTLEMQLKDLDDRHQSLGKQFVKNVALGASNQLGGALVNLAMNEANNRMQKSYDTYKTNLNIAEYAQKKDLDDRMQKNYDTYKTNLNVAEYGQKKDIDLTNDKVRKELGLSKGGMSDEELDKKIRKILEGMS